MQDELEPMVDDASSETRTYCTAALTGQAFQEIYVCRRCCSGGTCICQACAQVCHADCRVTADEKDGNADSQSKEEEEAVEYIGIGPASCDCHQMPTDASRSVIYRPTCQCLAAALLFTQQHHLSDAWDAACTLPRREAHQTPVRSFSIENLRDVSLRESILQQAQTLVQHSKDTFWIDHTTAESLSSLCLLEQFAHQILQFHQQNDQTIYRGAEWWVQVKQTTLTQTTTDATTIEMHYDKDEALTEAFGLGVFPTYSTVTYLTDDGNNSAASTLIFPRTYHDDPEYPMPYVHVSRPVPGKHLVFEGSLLHGAIPLASPEADSEHGNGDNNKENMMRVTFLVNLWKCHHRMDIHELPRDIRQALIHGCADDVDGSDSCTLSPMRLEERKTPLSVLKLSADADDDDGAEYVKLPFVQDGLVVRCVALSPRWWTDDLVQFFFPKGKEAFLEDPDFSDSVSDDLQDK